jgi:F0F1-type ATP synthase alpha subunit
MYSVLYAANNGAFDVVPIEKIDAAREALLRELKGKHAKLTEAINTGDKPTDEQNEQVMQVAKSVAASYEVKAGKAETK